VGESEHGEGARIVIAGGGFAGLESLLALSELADGRAGITLVAPTPEFVYRPLSVEEPYGSTVAERHQLAPICEERGATFLRGAVEGVDAEAHSIALDDGSQLGYDAALLCVGARSRPALRNAITLRSAAEPIPVEDMLAGSPERIAFVMPPGPSWPLPIYELALLSQREARRRGMNELKLVLVTPEDSPLIAFGTRASEAVAQLLEARGIETQCGCRVAEDEGGRLVARPGGEPIGADRVVAMPVLEGPALPGVPADRRGFIPIDDHARVKGAGDLYAAGDGTNFPIKHGGIGTQAADAACEQIAAELGAPVEPRPFHPVIRGKLLTGEESLNLSQDLTGGAGEGQASLDYLWWPPHKVSGRYLAPYLAGEGAGFDQEPPVSSLDVEVALPHEWHREPMTYDPDGAPRVD
jgi:sulfide:quinone oxidoreductase